jgi:multiple sugar transport system ATP-binding protein
LARVEKNGLRKEFEGTVAVENLDLSVKDKEFVVLLGPSGCGKTTTLRMIAGLESPTDGDIFIGDRLVNDLEPKDRNIAMVFQSYALYPHMTVYKNLAFPLENAKVAEREIVSRVNRTARLLQIEDLLSRKPAQLSGGQRQRVAVGRAIVREPEVFLMDEPLSNLDAKLRLYMRAELKRLQKDIGVTTIYVTHDQVEAMTMADRIAIMNKGVLQQHGPPERIYSHPSNTFVAGFIGNPPTNFIEGSFVEDSRVETADFVYPLSDRLLAMARNCSSTEIVLGVRPQDVVVSFDAASSQNAIEAEVFTVEPLGDSTILDLKVGATRMKAVTSPDFPAEMGGRVWTRFRSERVYIFDKKTGDAML